MTRAEQAEEIVLLRNELAGTRKKLAKLESQNVTERDERGATPAVVPEWAETNGHRNPAQEPHVSGRGLVGLAEWVETNGHRNPMSSAQEPQVSGRGLVGVAEWAETNDHRNPCPVHRNPM